MVQSSPVQSRVQFRVQSKVQSKQTKTFVASVALFVAGMWLVSGA